VRIRTSRGPGFGNADILDHHGRVNFVQHGCLHRCFLVHYYLLIILSTRRELPLRRERPLALAVGPSLRRRKQFANLGHADRAIAEQMARDCVLRGIFRQPERIAGREAMIKHQPRQQQTACIAAHLVDAAAFPGKRYRACNMIKQAGRTSRLGLVLGARRDLAREADRAIDKAAQPVAPGLRHMGTVVEPGMQVGGKRGFRTVAADRALHCVERDNVACAFPDRAEMRVAQQARGREFLDVADAAAHLQGVAADFSSIARGTEFQRRCQDTQQGRAASWLPASARSERIGRQKLIDSACSVASMIFINCRRPSGRSTMRLPNTTRFFATVIAS